MQIHINRHPRRPRPLRQPQRIPQTILRVTGARPYPDPRQVLAFTSENRLESLHLPVVAVRAPGGLEVHDGGEVGAFPLESGDGTDEESG